VASAAAPFYLPAQIPEASWFGMVLAPAGQVVTVRCVDCDAGPTNANASKVSRNISASFGPFGEAAAVNVGAPVNVSAPTW